MKNKILKAIIGMLLVIIMISLLIIAYYMIADIETKEPKEIESTCDVKTEKFMERKIFIVTPNKVQKSNNVILYFHGGSYVAEATKNHWNFIEQLVNDTGSTVILPDYPLTPKYSYKDVFNMVEPLYKEIIEKVNTENLIIMGDSAGGGLALALEEKMCEENINMPDKTILISPWLDVRLNNPEIEEIQKKDTILNKETLKLAGIAYAGKDGIDSYLVNPIDGDLSKLKNATILTGTDDILNPDVYVLAEKAKQQGTKIDIKEYECAKHIWIIEKNSSEELIEQGYKEILRLVNV